MTFDPRQTALDYLECVRNLETEAMLTRFAEGAKVWLPGQGWIDAEALTVLLDGARSRLVDGIRFEHVDVLLVDNRVVVMTECDSPLVGGGSYVNHFCFVFTFDEAGLIAEMREYTDSAPAIAAFHT
ncbi:nuclear transport factor 2 family protein [Alteraurantiacibacter aquimixticola]|uniref:Nuclear transport factor 2 family protein n=1 Tax=Alteraurantiacibacter aquimixticola TaxID=2489173 RepID=A0A4T3EWV6_9SPHN|nr:nuclear transport factor 2 family protein [Alteraurantiacibacter aquimixticola]TIX49046.1 nuclear transport factor 2 family protein [Alteraurantiacibacter aquimixticola]